MNDREKLIKEIIASPHKPDENNLAELRGLQSILLCWATDLFGERDKSWKIRNPIFDDTAEYPHIYYPEIRKGITYENPSEIPKEERIVYVILSSSARKKWNKALFQMAHEVIHLLNPTGGKNANYLEEGVACAFSYYVQRRLNIVEPDFCRYNLPSYDCAHSLVRRLPAGDIAASKRIRRELQGIAFSAVTEDDLKAIFPEIDQCHAEALASPFQR